MPHYWQPFLFSLLTKAGKLTQESRDTWCLAGNQPNTHLGVRVSLTYARLSGSLRGLAFRYIERAETCMSSTTSQLTER
jgi:hypothetical protein